MVRTLPVLLLVTLALAACSASTPTPLPTPVAPTLGESWAIKMNQAGGIMGLSRSIEISSDGEITATDEGSGKTTHGQVSEDELAELKELIRTLKPAPVPGLEQSVCADCFVYTIEIRDGDTSFTTQVDDITLPSSGMSALVDFLRNLMEESLE
jgi:DNA-directed RNA polymerase specialized sigma54-like protein